MFHRSPLFLAAALLSCSPIGIGISAPACELMKVEGEAPAPARKRRRARIAVSAPAHRRSKNAPTKRRLKANRLHIGRRVRRKHRRAA